MRVGRNDSCPCGSGKKYKKCCLESDQRAAPGGRLRLELAGEARGRIAEADTWEADVVPMPGSLSEDPTSRPGVVLVMADGFVVHGDSVDRLSPEPEALAATVEADLAAALEKAGKLPRLLRVRHPEPARALAARLASRATAPGVEVAAGCIHDLDEAAFDMLASLRRGAAGPAWRALRRQGKQRRCPKPP